MRDVVKSSSVPIKPTGRKAGDGEDAQQLRLCAALLRYPCVLLETAKRERYRQKPRVVRRHNYYA
jgi:hypothetical protein